MYFKEKNRKLARLSFDDADIYRQKLFTDYKFVCSCIIDRKIIQNIHTYIVKPH